jgi:hypothetical protein
VNYLAFDIETAKITESGDNLDAERPLGICCWAVAQLDMHGKIIATANHGQDNDCRPTPRMDRYECAGLVKTLTDLTHSGYTLLTHNGVGFDLDILAEESGLHAECVELALNSVDTMLHFHCIKGFPVGLNAISKGMGLAGKTEGMHGDLAPVMWAEGRYEEVLAYVGQDVISTLETALAVEKAGVARWIAKSGRLNSVAIPKWLTVREALKLPLPNTSWMDSPFPREKFTGWMKETP